MGYANGRVHEKSKSWFGYKLHLIVDTDYEMPVEFSLQPGNDAEIPAARKLIKTMKKNHPKRLKERCRHNYGDQKVMPFRGFEEKRKTLKYAPPADHYGVDCLR